MAVSPGLRVLELLWRTDREHEQILEVSPRTVSRQGEHDSCERHGSDVLAGSQRRATYACPQSTYCSGRGPRATRWSGRNAQVPQCES
jgi:hypothetical protein